MFHKIGKLSNLLAVLLFFGLPGTVMAGSCESNTAAFSSSIGSTTTCSSISTPSGEPLSGCVVGSGGTSCPYSGVKCDFVVNVPKGVGKSQDKSTTYFISPGIKPTTCQVKFAITRGNQSSSYCRSDYPAGTLGDTMLTRGNNGNPITHKQLEVCTDEQFVTVSPPVISLEKQVVRVIDGAFDCNDATDELAVIAPTEVVYCYTVRNDGLGTIDNLRIDDDSGTPLDPSDDLIFLNDGTGLPGNGSVLSVDSDIVLITDAGELVNTATVAGTFEGDPCATCSDSDTATVNVVVECDATTQTQANETGAVVETRGLESTTRCAPKDDTAIDSVGLLCDSACKVRAECLPDGSGLPLPPQCVQPCEPSGNWTSYDTGGVCLVVADEDLSPSELPLCQEALTNPGNDPDCGLSRAPTPIRSDGHSFLFQYNPAIYYFPASGGGNSVGTIYCILYPGETADVCPPGAIVY